MAGWMIDVDHMVDCWYYIRRARVAMSLFLIRTGRYFELNGRVLVPFHAWELTVIFILLALLYEDVSVVFFSAALAHGAHLLQDQLKYRVRPLGYWLSFRYQKRFAIDQFRSDD